ncbi:Enoyl-CoA hydratase/isomerase [Novosphingobium aromaticivorans DSM 12444]|uniref:Enoyl-CoA hydratase/isomerase n=2 Tax=Novosphingobium aromaticivorans (strain ATCC 700278 / DSM 12444 / CCUG 56034 / CIP 105152 / NBRC 16084 / F199) TaxID=279238 RepID=Q2GB08_NOVAD|nr:enoyl-CoA hydratase/isomerase family protein [Novosphingobium aromaticivorans]ABD24965.1 Enoyl-CoA hydratase/isomerase [Novosphingobium aromaticivorans DSM 12444]SCY86283.1 enoyl-CoA hydratase [Novosphingobium aromaticivorans]
MDAVDGVRLEEGDAIDWIVFDRPQAANSFSATLLEQFSALVKDRQANGAPVLGIRGSGRGFSSGMDLGEYNATSGPTSDVLRLSSYVERWLDLWRHPKPVIVAVHGYCIGVAAQLASFADILVVAEDAMISEPTIPIGGGFIAPTWVSHVGSRHAKEFAFLPGNRIDGRMAAAWGWANCAVPASEVIACCESLAQRMKLMPPAVLAMKKRSINRAMEAAGFHAAASAIAESDALLHLEPEVTAIRNRLRTEDLKAVVGSYAGESSQEIFQRHGGHRPDAS